MIKRNSYLLMEYEKLWSKMVMEGEILELSKQDGEEVKKCYIKYLDVFTSYYKTARVPNQEYRSNLDMPTKIVKEGKEYTCLASHQTPSRRRDLRKRLRSRHIRNVSGSPEPRRGRPESPRKKDPKRKTMFKWLENIIFHKLGDKGKTYSNDSRHQLYHSSCKDTERYYQSSRSRGKKPASDKHHNKIASSHKKEAMSESEGSAGGYWKSRGVLILISSKIIPIECTTVSRPEGQSLDARQAIKERIKKPANMTGVPRRIVEHQLNIWEGCPSVRQKKRSQAVDRNHAIQEKVEKLIDAGIMKEVHYH
nr:reverse transcriptase domain-containing protein [Tanacetum cinerariifolium]